MESGSEWRNSFSIQYNTLLNGNAPGLNDYEMSWYLTKAQKEIVNEYYTGFYSKRESYEETERIRRILYPIIGSMTVQAPEGKPSFDYKIDGIEEGDIVFYKVSIDANTYRIVEESAKIQIGNKFKYVLVKPERHDYYWKIKNNPFRSVNDKRVWRFDVGVNDGSYNIELLSRYPIREYRYRYLKNVEPIIISDLTSGEFYGLGLSIEGKTQENNSPLKDIHLTILNRAVELATRDYKENNLNNQVMLNDRSL